MANKEGKETKSVGEASRDLQMEEDLKINPIDLQRAVHAGNESEDSFECQLLECLGRGKKETQGPFFLVVLFKKERIMQNVVRQYFLWRHTCPTPQFDQTVYRYDPTGDELAYLWSVPDKHTCHELYNNRYRLTLEMQPLAQFCADFLEGALDKRCAQLNGEEWNG